MKKLTTILLLLLAAFNVSAEGFRLAGTVRDTTRQPMPFVTVALFRPDSTIAGGATTNDLGEWQITDVAQGRYTLSVTFVGYNPEQRELNITKNLADLDFTLKEEAQQICEVVVEAKRPLIERRVDKIVMNVSESPFANGTNMTDMLRKAPGVTVDKDGNVKVNGKAVTVYINGRPSYLSGDQLRGLLDGTDGSTVEKVEIITNPSAKYDAAGQGGIINIKLKRNTAAGLFGTVSAGYGGFYYKNIDGWRQNGRASLNLNYSGKQTYTSVMLSAMYGQNSSVIDSRNGLETDGHRTELHSRSVYDSGAFQYYSARISNDWMIDKKNTLGFVLSVPVMLYGMQTSGRQNYTETLVDGTAVERAGTDLASKSYSPQHTANLNYTHTFSDSLSRELTANIFYIRNDNRGTNSQMLSYDLGPVGQQGLDIRSRAVADIYSAKVDFQTMFWRTGMIECGLKWTMTNTRNRMTTDSTGIVTSTTPMDFNYSEQVAAAYITLSKQFDKHWSAKLGLRGEYTRARGEWLSADTTTGYHHFGLFPTAFLAYAPTDNWMISASYTRRIDRPSYGQMNPFVEYMDAHTMQRGNPDLRPSTGNRVSLNIGYSQYVSLAFDVSTTRNDITSKPVMLPNGDMMLSSANLGQSTRHSLSLSVTEVPLVHIKRTNTTWLTLTVSLTGANERQRDDVQMISNNWSLSVYGSLSAHLPLDFKVVVDGWYQTPEMWGYMKSSGMGMLNVAVRKQFLKKTLTLSLQATDLLNSMNVSITMAGLADGQSYTVSQEQNQRRISIGLSYNFGQAKYHKYRRVGELEESSRVGGSGGGLGK